MEWRASHILVKEKGLAVQLAKKAKGSGNFSAMAKEFSTCPSKSKGGDLGWFGPGKMVPKFEQACQKMRVGAVSDVVATQFGFHIIKLTGKR